MDLSLRHIRMTPRAWWQETVFSGHLDIERSSELDGVLLANRFTSAPVNYFEKETKFFLSPPQVWF